LKKDIVGVFLREKPAHMLTHLRDAKENVYASALAKRIDCTYSHVVKVLQHMERNGLVRFDKQGRLKLLTLTKKGTEVAEHIHGIKTKLL